VALQLGCDLAVIDKRRPQAGVSEVMNIIGNVEGYTCIMVDDIVDSAGTLCNAANSLLDHGAASVVAYVTHGVLSGKAYDNIDKSGIHEVVITDTIAPTRQTQKNDKIRVITIAPLMAEAIKRIACNESVSSLFI
jgi:ribose-phosphate pyrophosphokinase